MLECFKVIKSSQRRKIWVNSPASDPLVRGAVIEVGTNSVKLMIADIDSNRQISTVHYNRKITRLGQNLEQDGALIKPAMVRTAEVVEKFWQRSKEENAGEIFLVGTHPLRVASNTEDFADRIKNSTGLDLEVLTGEQEAMATRNGVSLDCGHLSCSDIVIIDVGGGSTEILKGVMSKSLPIGAVHITDSIFKSDPPAEEDIVRASSRIRDHFLKDISFMFAGDHLHVIGTGGSIMTATGLIMGLEDYDREKIHHSVINQEQVEDLFNRLSSVDIDTRRQMMKIDPDRADTIIAGLLILKVFFRYFHVEQFLTSIRNVIHGVFYQKFIKYLL